MPYLWAEGTLLFEQHGQQERLTDFGSRYGKVPIGDIFAIGVAVISPKSTKTSSKTAFTFPDCLS